MVSGGAALERLRAAAYVIPTDLPEADGTIEWRSTTLVVAHASAAGHTGIGYTYTDAAAAALIDGVLAETLDRCDVMAIPAAWERMVRRVRNIGRPGLAACAISAVDCALWDLKCRLLGLPLVQLLGAAREAVPAYASGGFTSYSPEVLRERLADWAEAGFFLIKMKVGSRPEDDVARVRLAREAIGPEAQLFVDANGAYARKQALQLAESFARCGVSWFEEPVSSDDLEGLRLLRDRAPAEMEIAAGEYGYDAFHFRRLLEHGAVDVLQVDATRCGGITGFCRAVALADAHGLPVSSHCAPALHVHACCALPRIRHLEYFHDHVRIERMLFIGAPAAQAGMLAPDPTRPGFGLELDSEEAQRHATQP